MSPTDRCDEVMRLIDEALEVDEASDGRSDAEGRSERVADGGRGTPTPDRPDVEAVPGQWGVYYLRPGI